MKAFRLLGIWVLVIALVGMIGAQDYKPRSGETVMKLAVEGRGNVYIRLYTKEAPKTTKHISNLVKKGFYDGQKFFRVVTTPRPYIAQIGDPQTKTKDIDDPSIGNGGSGERVPYEDTKKSNETGTVGLSTLPKDRDSGDSQFYINLAPNKFFDGNYTVFGVVVDSMEVVRKIQRGDRVTKATILEG
jgi:cyclophilin family peptidyl-prolyl cis-trans isomerase